MRLVVDANIFVAELIRQRGRALISRNDLELFVAEAAWDEAQHELRKRIQAMVNQGKFSIETGEMLLETAFTLAEAKARLIPE
jgi:predicted nucleic acid-binding protein